MNAPTYEALLRYKKMNNISFHTPGHKGKFLKNFSSLDFTELSHTDDLYNPKRCIKETQDLASAYFKTEKTLFSSGGNTLCIQAMISLLAKPHEKIICARNIHKSALNTVILLGLRPVWIYNKIRIDGLFNPITFSDVKKTLKENPDAKFVYITSPDYYGLMCDVKKISLECKRKKIPLLVDNAHGSFLFCSKKDLHPIKLGATMCADSAHKTLPTLTQGAFLHINSKKYVKKANSCLALFGSTSPSFPILASLDLTRDWMQNFGKKAFSKLVENVKKVKIVAKNKGFLIPEGLVDPTRLSFFTTNIGISGHEFANILRNNKIEIEFSTNYHVVLIPTAFNRDKDFEKLCSVISNLDVKNPIKIKFFNLAKAKTLINPREAFFKESKKVLLEESLGKIVGEAVIPCPPGIPILIPGEEVSKNTIKTLKFYKIEKINVISKN